jgi:hypothetical protein
VPYRLTFKNTLPLIIKYLSIFPISLIYILILKFYTMPNHTTHHNHFWVYPHPLLTTVKLYTREHLYSHTHTHVRLRKVLVICKLQRELSMIIPSPLRTRLIVGIGGYPADFEVVSVVGTIFSLCAFCLQVCDCQRVARIARARSLLSRIVCVVCL